MTEYDLGAARHRDRKEKKHAEINTKEESVEVRKSAWGEAFATRPQIRDSDASIISIVWQTTWLLSFSTPVGAYSNTTTERRTSPAAIARNASLTSSRPTRRVTMSSRLSRPCR